MINLVKSLIILDTIFIAVEDRNKCLFNLNYNEELPSNEGNQLSFTEIKENEKEQEYNIIVLSPIEVKEAESVTVLLLQRNIEIDFTERQVKMLLTDSIRA